MVSYSRSAIVVLYLLTLSSVATFFSVVHYNRIRNHSVKLEYLTIAQFYFFFGFALAVLGKANDFGSAPLCTGDARITIFGSFKFIPVGRSISIVFTCIVIVIYTYMLVIDYELIDKIKGLGTSGTKNVSPTSRCVPKLSGTTAITPGENNTRPTNASGGLPILVRDDTSWVLIFNLLITFVVWALLVANT